MRTNISKLASPIFALALLFASTAVVSAADSTAKPAGEKASCCHEAQSGQASAGAHCDRPAQSGEAKADCAEHHGKAGEGKDCCCDECSHASCDRPAEKKAAPKR